MPSELTFDFTLATLDSRITFSRAGATATRTNSSGLIESVAANTPRFDYSSVTLQSKGLLIEESRINYALRSSELSVSPWTITGILPFGSGSVVNATASPDGTVTADKIVATTAAGEHYAEQVFSITANQAYAASCFVKPDLAIEYFAVTAVTVGASATVSHAFLKNTNGVVTLHSSSNFITGVDIEAAANGFYRVVIKYTLNGTVTSHRMRCYAVTSSSGASTTGDGVSGVCFWGDQLEVGAFATSHIPTIESTVTRNADVAVITGSNFTSFWNATQGGATVQSLPSTVSGIRPLVQYDDGTANEIIALRGNTTNPELYIVDGGTPQAQLDAGTIAANTAYSLTGWWATNDCRARKDSGAAVTDATATIPTVTQARIGSDGTNYLNGTIATINYYAAFSSQIYTRRKNKVFSSLF